MGTVINEVNGGGFAYLFNENRERCKERPDKKFVYPLDGIPVTFTQNGRCTASGQEYVSDIHFDKEAAVDDLVLAAVTTLRK